MSVNEAKVVFLGRAAVGKTSIIEHYCRKTFSEFQEPTIGAAFNTVTVPTTPESTRIGIWDTAGQERYDSLCPMYYRNAACAVIVYDVTDRESLAKANHWLTTLHKDFPDTSLILSEIKLTYKKVGLYNTNMFMKLHRTSWLDFMKCLAKVEKVLMCFLDALVI